LVYTVVYSKVMEVHMTFPVSQAIQYDSGKEKPNI